MDEGEGLGRGIVIRWKGSKDDAPYFGRCERLTLSITKFP
jgi:hypothetical protein